MKEFLYVSLACVCLSSCEAKQQSSQENLLTSLSGIEEQVDVVYQRHNNIWLRKHGSEDILFAKDAYWPRWSPNGKLVAYFSSGIIKQQDLDTRKIVDLVKVKNGVALAWHPAGNWIYFSTGDALNRIGTNGEIENLANSINIRELDVSPNGTVIATVKKRGYAVVKLGPDDFDPTPLGRGCSASFSPDGQLITVLRNNHKTVDLYSSNPSTLPQPLKYDNSVTLDNHFWTNFSDWITAETEGQHTDIVLIHRVSGNVFNVTDVGNATRGDVFIRSE